MVAEPKDLVSGRTLAPADGVQQAEGIVRYRHVALLGLRYQDVGDLERAVQTAV